MCCIQVPQEKAAPATGPLLGAQAAERQACWTLWAQVCSSSVSECLSGSCSSLDVMVLWTFSRKLLVPAGRGQIFTHQTPPGGPPGGAALTILVSVVGPVGALLGVVGGDPQLQRRNAGKVLIVWKDGAASVTLPPAVWGWRCRLTLTQLAEEMNRPVVAALGRVQVDQELDVQTGHLPLQDVGDALALLVLVLPLPAADVGTTEDRRTG